MASHAFRKVLADLGKEELAVLVHYHAIAADSTARCETTLRRVAGATGLDYRNVDRGIKGLTRKGLVKSVFVARAKDQLSVWELLEAPIPEEQSSDATTVGDRNRRQKGGLTVVTRDDKGSRRVNEANPALTAGPRERLEANLDRMRIGLLVHNYGGRLVDAGPHCREVEAA